MFLDLEKVLDSIDWTCMSHVLSRMGFGPTFLKWIFLYERPMAALRLNGRVSGVFPVAQALRKKQSLCYVHKLMV